MVYRSAPPRAGSAWRMTSAIFIGGIFAARGGASIGMGNVGNRESAHSGFEMFRPGRAGGFGRGDRS